MTPRDPGKLVRRTPLLVPALLLALAVQLASATWLVPSFLSPNPSTLIARNLASTGRYEGGSWSLLIGDAEPPSEAPRMYQLPGEAVYLALWFRYLPPALHRYAHVPVTTALIGSVSLVALCVGGPGAAAAAAIIATLQPFTILHGPVWDDTFLGAGLVWTIIAILTSITARPPQSGRGPWTLMALGGLAAMAGLTRTLESGVLLAVGVGLLLPISPKRLRPHGLAVLAGLLIALSAWGFRNYRVVGEFSVSSSHDGLTLYQSIGPMAVDGIRRGQVERFMTGEIMGPHWERVAGMSEPEINRYFRREAVAYAVDHPMRVVGTALLKIGISLAGIRPELPIRSFRNVIALISNLLLISLTGLWVVLLWQGKMSIDRPVGFFLCVIATAVIALLALGPIGWRYRIALDGVLWIGSASVLTRWMGRLTVFGRGGREGRAVNRPPEPGAAH